VNGPLLLPTWEQLAVANPQVVATMRRYLQQVACVLRPGSVSGTDLALRSFAAFLVDAAPGGGVAEVTTAGTSRTTGRGWRRGPGRTSHGSAPPHSCTGSARYACSSSASTSGLAGGAGAGADVPG
jgi:hypothetical protein